MTDHGTANGAGGTANRPTSNRTACNLPGLALTRLSSSIFCHSFAFFNILICNTRPNLLIMGIWIENWLGSARRTQ
jgi:hypothetical protein